MSRLVKITLFLVFSFIVPKSFAACYWWQDCTQYQTKYPIMLVHGFLGFDDIGGVVQYWHDIPRSLEERGATVLLANVSAVDTPQARGEQLIEQIENALAINGGQKVNLMGHSLGGPTIRYVAKVRPDLVASVTTISAANYGARIADVVSGVTGGSQLLQGTVAGLVNALGTVIDTLSGAPEVNADALALLASMQLSNAAQFNQVFNDGMPSQYCGQGAELVNGIRYYSWGGNAGLTHVLDPVDYALQTVDLFVFGSEANDGVLRTCGMNWGRVLGNNYFMNHLDVTNNTLGLHSWFETDPVTLYKNHAIRLKSVGL